MRATVLCYNLKGTAKGRKIGLIFGFLGYRVRHVEKEEYMLPVGEVAEGRTTESINEEAGVKTKEIEAVFQEEMLLMCPEMSVCWIRHFFVCEKKKCRFR